MMYSLVVVACLVLCAVQARVAVWGGDELALTIFKGLLKAYIGDDADKALENLRNEKFTQIVKLSDEPQTVQPIKKAGASDATPVVQMHGMGDFANDPGGMVPLANAISEYLGGAYVLNVQIGDSSIADIMNGFIMNLDDQVDYFANVVASDANLAQGFNAVGYSQGNLVIRGYIEKYNSPPVFNFISMHGPLAGVGSFPGCSVDHTFCRAFAELLGALAYKPLIQDHLAQANYFRDPMKIPQYIDGDIFLADINNEQAVNGSYSKNWASLNSVCLVKALADATVVPNDSEWYGFFQDGSFDDIWEFSETPWYKENLFGLKTLDEEKKVFFEVTEGGHLDFSTDYLLNLVGLYFV